MLAMGPNFGLQTSECLALVVQKVESPVYPINQNPLDNYYQHSSAIHFIGIFFLFHLSGYRDSTALSGHHRGEQIFQTILLNCVLNRVADND